MKILKFLLWKNFNFYENARFFILKEKILKFKATLPTTKYEYWGKNVFLVGWFISSV